MTELLPCPFCGGEADLDEIPGSPFTTETYSWGAGCKDCNIGWYNENKAEAIAAWNKRAVKLNMSVEKLAEVLVKIDDDENPLGYCKSDCEEVDGCPHPVKCCVKWLMGEVDA